MVALHHQGIAKTNADGQLVDREGNVLIKFDKNLVVWIANEGIRTSRIVKAIERAAVAEPSTVQKRNNLLRLWSIQRTR